MIQLWLVYCPSCNSAVTEAKYVDHPDFADKVECTLCGRLLDARNGHFVYHAPVFKNTKKRDLLEVK